MTFSVAVKFCDSCLAVVIHNDWSLAQTTGVMAGVISILRAAITVAS